MTLISISDWMQDRGAPQDPDVHLIEIRVRTRLKDFSWRSTSQPELDLIGSRSRRNVVATKLCLRIRSYQRLGLGLYEA